MEAIRALVDFILHIDVHLNELLVQYGPGWMYGLLFVIVFCETGLVVTPFLPGDSLLFAAGALAASSEGTGGPLNVHLIAGLLIVAAIVGDSVNYAIGRRLGARAFKMRFVKPEYIERTQAFYARHGGKTIILARFVPIVRTFAPFVAGMAAMEYRKFITYNVVGGIVWVVLFLYAGYFFGNLPFVKENFGLVAIAIIVLSILPMVVEYFRARRRTPASPDVHS
jgi:membrane-associated protein